MLMKERPNYSVVNDRLLIDSDADISSSQFQKTKACNKLNQNKWEKPVSLFTKEHNVNDSLFSFRPNNEKDDYLSGTKWDKSNTSNLNESTVKRNWSKHESGRLDKNKSYKNLSKTNRFNDRYKGSREKNYEITNRSETFNESSKKNWTGSKYLENTNLKTMKSSESKYLNEHLEQEKKVQPRLSQIVQHRKEIDIKPGNKVDFVSALTELKATQEINIEDEDDSSAFRARQKFSKKDKIVETSEHRKPKFLKKERELQEEERYFDNFDTDYEFDRPKKKDQTHQIKQKLQREIFIPDAISVSNLAKIIGIHLGEKVYMLLKCNFFIILF
jgi:hypothetical protein